MTTVSLAAGASPGSALWYLSRATGVTTLALLTVVVLLGVLTQGGHALPGVPRFVVALVHRNASLLTVSFLIVHVLTSVLDPFAPIRLTDAVIPFTSAYRPIWLGLGAFALDLLAAIVITSLLRLRIGRNAFRAVHWLAYAAWPVALVHGLGTGSDVHQGWLLLLTAACVGAVLIAVLYRVSTAATTPQRRALATAAALLAPVLLAGWIVTGPLAPGWAARSGTPPSLLHQASSAASAPGNGTTGTTALTTQRSGDGQAASGPSADEHGEDHVGDHEGEDR